MLCICIFRDKIVLYDISIFGVIITKRTKLVKISLLAIFKCIQVLCSQQ